MNNSYPYYEHQIINNFKELIELNKEKKPNDIAFFYNEKGNIINKTYLDFYQDVVNLHNYLFKHFKNKHIAIIGENSYRYLVLYFAIVLSNNCAVLIDKDLDKETIERLLKNSDTKDIFYSESYLGKNAFKGNTIEEIDNFIQEGKLLDNKYIIDDDKLAVIFFTSGTTGANKGVMLSQKNITHNIVSAASIFLLEGPVLSVLPYHHAFGLNTSVLAPFFYGYPIFINNSLKTVLKDMQTAKPNTLFLVPLFVETFYKQIWANARKTKKDKLLKLLIGTSDKLLKIHIDLRRKLFKSILKEFGYDLKYIICGGAYLDEKYIKWFNKIGITILNGYGITECSPVVSVNRNKQIKEGSIGHLCKDFEAKVIDGEIAVKSDSVMLGYYNDQKATKEVLIDGWFKTGDFGYIDDDQFLFITGRKKNLIILNNGENVSPEVIEAKLAHDDAVSEVMVYAKNNQTIAQIYPEEDYIGNQEYFNNLIYEYNKDEPKNRQIALVMLRTQEFPKNTNKKILRNKVMEEEWKN